MIEKNPQLALLEQRLAQLEPSVEPGHYLAYCPHENPFANGKWPSRWPGEIGDNFHFPLNYALLMRLGLKGIVCRARTAQDGLDERQTEKREIIACAYEMLIEKMREFSVAAEEAYARTRDPLLKQTAENCAWLCENPPRTFCQGVQLFWLVYQSRGLHFSSLGRLDQTWYPLYRDDIMKRNAREEAFAILAELWKNFNIQCSGDTLMNLMLGGTDEDGKDVTNDLSALICEVTLASDGTEPHINIRVHENTPKDFLRTASKLIAAGRGQGVLYMDEAILPALVASGIPLKYARQYANDGCTEITFNGLSTIQFWQMEMVKSLELTLFNGNENPHTPKKEISKWSRTGKRYIYKSQLKTGFATGDITQMASFDEVWDAYLRQMRYQTDCMLQSIDAEIIRFKEDPDYSTSPVVNGLCELALDKGIDAAKGGMPVENWQLLSGSIPTTADALMAIKTVVFDRKLCTMDELLYALTTNFEQNETLRAFLLSAPKYGNDIDEVDHMAAAIADAFMTQVEQHPAPHGIHVLPGIYNIDYHQMGSALAATPDGRKDSDLVCDHYSPTPGRAVNGPTAILCSASKGNLQRGCASSPVQLALPRGRNDEEKVLQIIEALRSLRLPVVSLTFQDAEELRDAMKHPEKHHDLIVRVWGFNARFVELDEGLQQHILQRTLVNGV